MAEASTHIDRVALAAGGAVVPAKGAAVPLAVGAEGQGESVVEALLRSGGGRGEWLRAWAVCRIPPGEGWTRQRIVDALASDVASIDRLLGRQLDAILHHPRFQALEASWRGLEWLVAEADAAAGGENQPGVGRAVQVKALQCSKRDIVRDFEQATEFDQSAIWWKVYEEEFGTAGGNPFGLLVVDHAFGNHPTDLDCLAGLGEVAAASFAPIVATPEPDLLGVDSFARLHGGPPLDTLHRGAEFTKWRSLQARDDSRFLGLVLPRVLARRPYDGMIGPADMPSQAERSWSKRRFRYREATIDPNGEDRVWAAAAWAFAGVVVREFGRSGWFADIRGASRGRVDGGIVSSLPVETFLPDDPDALRGPADVGIPEDVERQLAAAGFIPLCAVGGDGRAVFHSNPSIHLPALRGTKESEATSRVASMLQYVLCASRIAHYLKRMARDKIGSFVDAAALEHFIDDWVQEYVTPDDNAPAATRAERPLRSAKIEVHDVGAGAYQMVMALQPHFQIDDVAASVVLRTKVVRQGGP